MPIVFWNLPPVRPNFFRLIHPALSEMVLVLPHRKICCDWADIIENSYPFLFWLNYACVCTLYIEARNLLHIFSYVLFYFVANAIF